MAISNCHHEPGKCCSNCPCGDLCANDDCKCECHFKPIDPKLLKVLCEMSDKDLEVAIEFHQYHLNQLLIQRKIRKNE